MSDRTRLWLSALAILSVAFAVWLPTLQWGLPSRDADKFLFGDRRPWTGAEIVALTATTQPATMRGADVDADPIVDRSKPVILNDTDAKRAAIVRRYRLMSGQPDEFIQFKALSEMAARPGLAKLDPRLYQYGGLWMYPVGALVRAAMLVGYIPSPPPGTAAIEFYLDHPEAFGKFYVVARFYSWCWGVVAAFAIAWIARRVTESIGLATLAAVAFMLLPVTRTATHEAKPHLAGAALCLCAVIAATRHVETGRRRWLIGAGALCGAAMAMVVSMLLACAVLPTMVWLRRRETLPAQGAPRLVADPNTDPTPNPRQVAGLSAPAITLMTSLAVAAIVYLATNPFALINAIAHPEILRSNLGNSTAMYSTHRMVDAFRGAFRIAAEGMTATMLILGLVATASVAGRFRSTDFALLGSVAALVAVQFVTLAAGKPAEYTRFAIVSVTFAVIAVTRVLAAARDRQRLILVATIGAIGCIEFALMITTHDKIGLRRNTRMIAEDRKSLAEGTPLRLGMFNEPAPWSAPAFDLFRSQIFLVEPMGATSVDRLIWPANLDRQIGRRTGCESLDWRENVLVDEIAPAATTRSR